MVVSREKKRWPLANVTGVPESRLTCLLPLVFGLEASVVSPKRPDSRDTHVISLRSLSFCGNGEQESTRRMRRIAGQALDDVLRGGGNNELKRWGFTEVWRMVVSLWTGGGDRCRQDGQRGNSK